MKALKLTLATVLTCGLLIGVATINAPEAHACWVKVGNSYIAYCAP